MWFEIIDKSSPNKPKSNNYYYPIIIWKTCWKMFAKCEDLCLSKMDRWSQKVGCSYQTFTSELVSQPYRFSCHSLLVVIVVSFSKCFISFSPNFCKHYLPYLPISHSRYIFWKNSDLEVEAYLEVKISFTIRHIYAYCTWR